MAHDPTLVLGVQQSVLGKRWINRLAADQQRIAVAMSQHLGLDEAIGRLLAARDVGLDQAISFLNPTIRELMPDPSTLQGLDVAVERLRDAVMSGETVALFGDYDVDGATSCALMALYLRHFGLDPIVHIPDRITEGYGPNCDAVDTFADAGVGLMITLDCGSMSHDVLGYAAKKGIDCLVIDHHQIGERLPEAVAIVNPNRQDDISGLGYLSAAGVTFMVLAGLNRASRGTGVDGPKLIEWLDLLALSTVCDVVPLTGLNRAFVHKGLDVAQRAPNAGLMQLARAGRLTSISEPYHFGFVLGPRINAGGRIGNAKLGVELLLADDPHHRQAIAEELDRLNTARRAEEAGMVEEAVSMAEARFTEDDPLILVCGDNWHPGIIGLVASRLKDRFARPAIAVALDHQGYGSGSARSIPGVDIGRAIRAAVEACVLIKGGGHAMAAGLTVAADNTKNLAQFLSANIAASVEEARAVQETKVDLAVTAGSLSVDFIEKLARVGPFGPGNPEPVFALPSHTVRGGRWVGENHFSARLMAQDGTGVKAMAFRSRGTKLGEWLDTRASACHLIGRLSINEWQGRREAVFHIKDAADTSR